MKNFIEVTQDVFNQGRMQPNRKIECKKCGLVEYPKIEHIISNNNFKATCKSCGSYHSFLKHSDINVLNKNKEIDIKILFIKPGDKQTLEKISEADYVFEQLENNIYKLIKSRFHENIGMVEGA